MNKLNKLALLATLTTALAGGVTTQAQAQAQAQALGASPAALPTAAASAADMTDGEIRKVDKSTQKITIKHGEIKNLDMPGMTMLFQAKDAAMLDRVKVGDKVKFHADNSSGLLVVTDIQVVR